MLPTGHRRLAAGDAARRVRDSRRRSAPAAWARSIARETHGSIVKSRSKCSRRDLADDPARSRALRARGTRDLAIDASTYLHALRCRLRRDRRPRGAVPRDGAARRRDAGRRDCVEARCQSEQAIADGARDSRRARRGARAWASSIAILKPANIMLTKSGVKLLDFGLARLPSGAESPVSRNATSGDGSADGAGQRVRHDAVHGAGAGPRRRGRCAHGSVCVRRRVLRNVDRPPGVQRAIATRADRGDSRAGSAAARRLNSRSRRRRSTRLVAHASRRIRPIAGSMRGDVVTRASRPRRRDERHRVAQAAGKSSTALNEAVPASPAVAAARRLVGYCHRHCALLVWMLPRHGSTPAVAANPQPVIVLMDSPLEGRVYDPRTLAAGGTNADDITDALRGLPIVTHKENTSPMWHREEEVRQQNPDLIVSHLSCLYDQRVADRSGEYQKQLFNMAQHRLTAFFGYVASVNPRTKFLVYSRGRFGTEEATWIGDVVARFPQMRGRLFTMVSPGRRKSHVPRSSHHAKPARAGRTNPGVTLRGSLRRY